MGWVRSPQRPSPSHRKGGGPLPLPKGEGFKLECPDGYVGQQDCGHYQHQHAFFRVALLCDEHCAADQAGEHAQHGDRRRRSGDRGESRVHAAIALA
ncbi:hypothetical protein SPHINGO391_480215 [Sphingomonas aurantiaca]|uniref:Uncharacterized protein n=1 Tax=Sphingomonas aurantiaca TaxID=185949 RepID=A0A5E8A2W0_9SPHN|nr:hypothetical protein SPHINGO391_480215 [Sphingomonas aurantiaca]